MVGTPDYLAPEVISGAEGDRRADLYALGVLAYEMLSGRLPFPGTDTLAVLYAQVNTPPPPLRSSNPNVPAEVEQVVNRQLSKRPDDRYPTATAFASALSDAAHGLLLLPGEGTLERFVVPGAGGTEPARSTLPPIPTPASANGTRQPVEDLEYEPTTPPTLFHHVPNDDTPTPQPIPRPLHLVPRSTSSAEPRSANRSGAIRAGPVPQLRQCKDSATA